MALTEVQKVSSTFIWRRIHSLMGLWLVIYLFEHLIVNSQAALWLGDDGIGFVKMVNILESLPFLQVIEWVLIGIPLLIHAVWGIKRALAPKFNSFGGGGKSPHLPYSRNRAFTWQRLTSWILLFGIIGHVVQMRFLGYPTKVEVENQTRYLNRISFDPGLYSLSGRLHVTLYSADEIAAMQQPPLERVCLGTGTTYSEKKNEEIQEEQRAAQRSKWIHTLCSFHVKPGEVVAEAPNPGTAMLLMVRDHFKSPLMAVLYTIFVLAAAFHAFNGFWTALITWGAVLSYRAQKWMIPLSRMGICLLAFLGLAAIWGSYWINLRS